MHESIILMLPPPICIAHTFAIRLHDYYALYDPPPDLLLYAIHHTILVMAISCKGKDQLVTCEYEYTSTREYE